MPLIKWVLIGLLLFPVAELAVFLAVASQIGLAQTLGLTLLTSIAGIALIARAGRNRLSRLRREMAGGGFARVEWRGGGRLVAAGLLLAIPGFLSDALAALVLLQPLIWPGALKRYAAPRRPRPSGRNRVIDLEPHEWRQLPQEAPRQDSDESPRPKRRKRSDTAA